MVGACIHMTQSNVRRAVHQSISVQPRQHTGARQSAVRHYAEEPRHLWADAVCSVCCDIARQVQLLSFSHRRIPDHGCSQNLKIRNKYIKIIWIMFALFTPNPLDHLLLGSWKLEGFV